MRAITVAICTLAFGFSEARADILELLQTNKLILRTSSVMSCNKGHPCFAPNPWVSVEEVRLVKDLVFVRDPLKKSGNGTVYPLHGEIDAKTFPLTAKMSEGLDEWKTSGEYSGDTISIISRQRLANKLHSAMTDEYHIAVSPAGCTASHNQLLVGGIVDSNSVYKVACEIVPLNDDSVGPAHHYLAFGGLIGKLASNDAKSFTTQSFLSFIEITEGRYSYIISACQSSQRQEQIGVDFNLKGGAMSGKPTCDYVETQDELDYTSSVEIDGDNYALTASGDRIRGTGGKGTFTQPLLIDVRLSLKGNDCRLQKLLVNAPGWWPSAPTTAKWHFTSTDASTCSYE
jgi:hypothetical protein